MSDSTFGFIGLGLIGGSIARGLRRANKDITIMAYMRTRSKLEQAKADGTIDMILDGIDETLSACDVIFSLHPCRIQRGIPRKGTPVSETWCADH